MPSMKIIKRRIASVRSTEKTMRAMNMVSASKLQRAKQRFEHARRLHSGVMRVVDDIKRSERVADSVFIRPRHVKNSAYAVITSDRGLCGSFNSNVCAKAVEHMSGGGKNECIIAVGVRGSDYFSRRGKNVIKKYKCVSETAFHEDAKWIGGYLASLYVSGKADEVFIAYTRFESTLSCVPVIEQILPIPPSEGSVKGCKTLYEPDESIFLNHLMETYMSSSVFAALVESSVCEHASRMVSMDAATKNTAEIIDDLTGMLNRKRQTAITQEISELVRSVSVMN